MSTPHPWENAPPDAPIYCPSPTAEDFILSTASGPMDEFRLLMIQGPRGEGKTTGVIAAILALGQRLVRAGLQGLLPIRVAVIRDTWTNLERTTLASFEEFAQKGIPIEWKNQRHEAIIAPYAHFFFFGMDNRQDADKLQGFTCGVYWLEEVAPAAELATGIPAESLAIGITSVRQPGVPKRIVLSFNPPDEDHWILSVEKTLEEQGQTDIRVHRFVMPPNEKAEHFKRLAEAAAHIGDFGRAKDWQRAAEEFEAYRRRNRLALESIGRFDLVNRLVEGKIGGVALGESIVPEFCDLHIRPGKEGVPTLLQGATMVRGWDAGLCVSEDTEILTDEGWRSFSDLSLGDRVATRAPASGRLEYQAISKIVNEWYDGPMVETVGSNLNVRMTPDHWVPLYWEPSHPGRPWRYRKIQARRFIEGSLPHAVIPLTATWSPEEPKEVGPFGWSPAVYANFMGWYLSEGSVNGRRVTIYQEKRADDLEAALGTTGLCWRETRAHGKRVGWRINHPGLATYLTMVGKRLPQDLRRLSAATVQLFLAAFLAGDGHVRKRPNGSVERVAFTSSKALAGDLQEAALLAGWRARITERQPTTSAIIADRNGRCHRARSRTRYVVTIKSKNKRGAYVREQRWRLVPYRGRVCCVRVPNGVIYLRRGGVAHWNGNTPSCVWIQVAPSGNIDVLGSRTSINKAMGQHILDEVVPFQTKYGLLPPQPTRDEGFGRGAKRGWIFRDIGDPAINTGSQGSRAEDTAGRAIENLLGTTFEPGPVEWSARRDALHIAFARKGQGNRLLVQIYEPENQDLIKGLRGRAHYPVNPATGRIDPSVEAAKRVSGLFFQALDALAYVLAVLFPAEEWLKKAQRTQVPRSPIPPPKSWVGA